MKYITAFDGYRYLTSEITIANGRRSIPDIHWKYAASKTIDRIERYSSQCESVDFLILPSKVTALSNYLSDYFSEPEIISWGGRYIENILKLNGGFEFYFNPILVSDKKFYFQYDSHWNCVGALSYFEPWLRAKFAIEDKYFLNLLKKNEKCIGNCVDEINKKSYEENYNFIYDAGFNIVFSVRNSRIPDFSVLKTANDSSLINERVLIIHSSSYEFARGFFSALFRETLEVFSPYVSDKVIAEGKFDRVIMIVAEKNAAVVYDGGIFSESINGALNQVYIREISNKMLMTVESEELSAADVGFLHALATSWSIYAN